MMSLVDDAQSLGILANRFKVLPKRYKFLANRCNYPPNKRKFPLNKSNVPLNQRKVSLNKSNVPLNQGKVSLNKSNVPLNQRKVSLNKSNVPLNQRKVSLPKRNFVFRRAVLNTFFGYFWHFAYLFVFLWAATVNCCLIFDLFKFLSESLMGVVGLAMFVLNMASFVAGDLFLTFDFIMGIS
ncbi:MAG: hypothetical protein LBS41_01890 [Streptococcaceae bacterium]|jgi:hypothetical protein|nr:hypothetical protein [Streptococcaceae bacterium]